MARLGGCVVVGALALGACSNETAVPDARVSVKQQALAQARTDAAAAAAHFCTTAADYVTAVDRYGDVLTATAPTVGDVQTAGTDLEQPRADATAAAQAAVDTQAAVVTAEKELAAAQAAAAAANTTAAGSSSATSPTPSPSPAPTVPPATVTRVKQAETEFTAAQQGISAQTPLRQAAQQFNAAAVALEMSWLALFADAGCLTDEAEKSAQKAVHDYTAALQQSLSDTGYFSGKVDGVYGPSTVDAVQALQKAHGLPVTGTVDKATQEALQSDLQAKGGAAAQEELASTAAVQQTLKLAGFWDGPVDGRWTPALTEALKEFQTELDVPATGTVDAATIAALEKAIAEAGKPTPSPTPSRSATSTAPEPSASTPKASTQT
ncbi:peptidoglycan-binding protein [Terrabacter sp. Soil810]|nr:peptidoglycan-binding protein [Terrabacter sp. Soil810]